MFVPVWSFPAIISLNPLLKWRFAPITMKPCRDRHNCFKYQGSALIYTSHGIVTIIHRQTTNHNTASCTTIYRLETLTLWYSTTSSMKSIPSARGTRTPRFVQSEHTHRSTQSVQHHATLTHAHTHSQSVHHHSVFKYVLLIKGTTDICNIVFRGACRGINWWTDRQTVSHCIFSPIKCI